MALAKDTPRPVGQKAIAQSAERQLIGQSWYVANELVRIWSAQHGAGTFANLKRVNELTPEGVIRVAGHLAKLSRAADKDGKGVQRRSVMALLKQGKLPEVAGLIRLARGLNRPVAVVCWPFSGTGAPRNRAINLTKPDAYQDQLGACLTDMRGKMPQRTAAELAGINQSTLDDAENGLVASGWETLFGAVTAHGYQPTIRFD